MSGDNHNQEDQTCVASLTHKHEWRPMNLNLADAEECRCGAVREARGEVSS